MTTLSVVLLCAFPIAGMAQPSATFDLTSKLRFHAEGVYSPWSVAGSAAYAGLLQKIDTPEEWGQGAEAYGKRVASTVAYSGIHAVLAFGLDSTLHQDPRYSRSRGTGFWRRTAHALKGTILTRTDSGRETVSTWRLGSAYGAAFLSNQWYPDRLNTVRLGVLQGSLQLGFDFARNLGAEFLPQLKRKILHDKPSLPPNDLHQLQP
jgi:hypothetical protein